MKCHMQFRICLVLCLALVAMTTLRCQPQTCKDTKCNHTLIKSYWKQTSTLSVELSTDVSALSNELFPLRLIVAPLHPDAPLPTHTTDGSETIDISNPYATTSLTFSLDSPHFAIVLRDRHNQVLDTSVVVHMPTHAAIVRSDRGEQFCLLKAWKQTGTCQPIARHNPTDRSRAIRHPDELMQMSKSYGVMGLKTRIIKFIIDRKRDHLVHFFRPETWSLHFTFAREVIEQKPPLDTCKQEEYALWDKEYKAFINQNMTTNASRRYTMGSLVYYPGARLLAIEFPTAYHHTPTQLIEGYAQLKRAIHASLDARILPRSETQRETLLSAANGKHIPLWDADAPYKGETTQLLSPGVAYGTFLLLQASQIPSTKLGLRTIAMLKDIPNDIPFVGGIVSTQFQSPLSHINVLSRNRGTPHLVLKQAFESATYRSLHGKLVRLEVTSQHFTLHETTRQEAEAFWKQTQQTHPPFSPSLDLTQQHLVDLRQANRTSLPTIGAKAANLAELYKLSLSVYTNHSHCRQDALRQPNINLPNAPIAVPFAWYHTHLQRANIADDIQKQHTNKAFLQQDATRQKKLAEWRTNILETPLLPEHKRQLLAELRKRFGTDTTIRFRSSTNVEDLPTFNGAGLYASHSARIEGTNDNPELALKKVWASLWNERAWDERTFANVEHTKAAMAVLIHPSFPNKQERANGVAVSANVYVPSSGLYSSFISVQQGSYSVVKPAQTMTPEQILISWLDPPDRIILSRSSLTLGVPVLTHQEALHIGCVMRAIHQHFQQTTAPRHFAMEAEFKIMNKSRDVIFKQARPYIFGEPTPPTNQCQP